MLLPPRPLRLKSSFVWKHQLGGIALLLLGVVAVVGYAWWQFENVRGLLEQSRLWHEGLEAREVKVSGQVQTRNGVLHSYDLDVRYLDQGGAWHDRKLEFDTLGRGIDQERDRIVRYAKENPDRFALSWAMDITGSRWAAIAFFAVVGVGLVGGAFCYLGGLALWRLAEARRSAVRSDEVLVRVTEIKPQVVKGRHVGNTYHFAGETIDGRAVTGKVVFPLKHAPLFVDPAQQAMIALVPPESLKRAVVVRDDFHPFLFNDAEQAQVREAIARRTPASQKA